LARQAEDAFAEYLPDLPSYVKRAGRRFQDEKRITITTLQSMVNDYAAYSSGYFDLVISDECHRSIYGKWSGVLKHFDGLQIGLTATPCVATPEVLAALEDAEDGAFVRDTLRFFELEQPTFRYGLKQAVQEGFLVPYRIYHALTVKTAAESGFPVSRSELDWSAMDAATTQEFEALFAKGDPVIVDPNALERRFTIPERNRAMVREFRDVVANGYTASDGVRRFPQDGKTIVFAVTKRHAATLAQMFDDAFADRKPSAEIRYADFVVSDTGADDTVNAMDKIKRFKKEPYPRILVSVNMLDTGFDCPEVVNLVMARFTKSAILYQQMRGRGTRRADTIKKTAFTMFDFTGVADFHGDDEDLPADGGFVVTAKKPDRDLRRRGLLVLDINDHIDPATRGWVTLDENGNEQHGASLIDPRAAELGARFEGWLLAQSALTPDRERILRMVGEVIRANASDLESFEAYHFANDPFRGAGGRRSAERLFGAGGHACRAERVGICASITGFYIHALTSTDRVTGVAHAFHPGHAPWHRPDQGLSLWRRLSRSRQ
jgi:type I restriction enzyme R subunit